MATAPPRSAGQDCVLLKALFCISHLIVVAVTSAKVTTTMAAVESIALIAFMKVFQLVMS